MCRNYGGSGSNFVSQNLEAGMKNLSKMLVIVGCLLLALSIVSKFVWPGLLHMVSMRSISFVIWANAAFLLAILLNQKKG